MDELVATSREAVADVLDGSTSAVGVDRQVRGRWISASSAERNLRLLRRAELAQLRGLGTVHYVDAGTVVAASGTRVMHVQVVSDGEIEPRARLDQVRATMAVVRTGGVIADLKRRHLVNTRSGHAVLLDEGGLREVMGSEPSP